MSSVVVQWPVRMIAAPVITSKAPKDFFSKGDDHGLAPCSLNAPAAGR